MYPRLPWELVVEPLGSAEHSLGTTSVQYSYKIVGVVVNIFGIRAFLNTFFKGLLLPVRSRPDWPIPRPLLYCVELPIVNGCFVTGRDRGNTSVKCEECCDNSNYWYIYIYISPLWSSGQSFWLQIQRSRIRFPALPDFLSSSGSGTGSTQSREPREVNWGATWMNEKSSGSRSVGTRCADHVTPLYPQKLALTSPTGGGCSVGIVRVRTKATEFSLWG